MPQNKLALLRYRIIDKCLQNRFRKWTLDDLIEAVSDGLYEYEGIHSGVSKRTIQLDIQTLRSDKLGYHAPIKVVERKFYVYEDPNYSITNSNVRDQDVDKLREVVSMLNQFKGFNYFEDLGELVGRLEDKIHKQSNSEEYYIDFEKNEMLRGLEWIDPLLVSIKKKKVLSIGYKSFKARQKSENIYYPYLLKEYRNRWFLLARADRNNQLQLLALDRMETVEEDQTRFFRPADDFVLKDFFSDVIGVTKSLGQKTSKVTLAIDSPTSPYIITKPLHNSQEVLRTGPEGIIVSIQVVLNFELERLILGYGSRVKVLSPRWLKKRIEKELNAAVELYKEE